MLVNITSRLSLRDCLQVSQALAPLLTHHYKALSTLPENPALGSRSFNRTQVRFKGDVSEAQRAWTGREEKGGGAHGDGRELLALREQKREDGFLLAFLFLEKLPLLCSKSKSSGKNRPYKPRKAMISVCFNRKLKLKDENWNLGVELFHFWSDLAFK